ncbi:MAG TPA: choice-of-anchor L domain-containing protein [Cytophagaceae bacterium]
MKRYLLVLIYSLFLVVNCYSQMVVEPVHPAKNSLASIVQSLVGKGVEVSNITSNLPETSLAYGTFKDTTGRFGISKGLLLTTGSVYNVPGPNNSGGTTSANYTPGDPDLTQIVKPLVTHDATVVEFDIIPTVDTLVFRYIFASEEYQEFVGSAYNDVFAFYISGPGIPGKKNLAVIPGTHIPVAINNVNHQSYTQYYIDNGSGTGGITGDVNLQYDGFTTVLKARIPVIPCKKYHLKFVIADTQDRNLDSGVFIEAGSLGAEPLTSGNIILDDNYDVCNNNLPILTAGNSYGATYEWTLNGNPVGGNTRNHQVTESGLYGVKVSRGPDCYWTDSVYVNVSKDFDLQVSNDTIICHGTSANLSASVTGAENVQYMWAPAESLSSPDSPNTIATPDSTTTYLITAHSGSACIQTAAVTVQVDKPIDIEVFASKTQICEQDTVQLWASGNDSYTWSPADVLNDATSPAPIATLEETTTFTVVSKNNCFDDNKSVTVEVYEKPEVKAFGDTTICYGGSAIISAEIISGKSLSIQWTPKEEVLQISSLNTVASPLVSTPYIVKASNPVCYDEDTVFINVLPEVRPKIGANTLEEEVPFTTTLHNVSSGITEFVWTLDGDTIYEHSPVLEVNEEKQYKILLKGVNQLGCVAYDSLTIVGYKLFIPNLITPNGDFLNDSFEITTLGTQWNVEIYNRWGNLVYKKFNYRNEWSAEGQSEGVYYYNLYNPVNGRKYQGWVQVIK